MAGRWPRPPWLDRGPRNSWIRKAHTGVGGVKSRMPSAATGLCKLPFALTRFFCPAIATIITIENDQESSHRQRNRGGARHVCGIAADQPPFERAVTLLHGSAGWRRELGGVGR